MGKVFTALKALPVRAIPVLQEDQAARVGLEVQVGRVDRAALVALEGPAVLEDRVVPGAQVVRVALGGPVVQVVPAVRVDPVVPGDPEEDRVVPGGTSDPAVSTRGLLRRRLQANHCQRNF